MNNFMNQAVSHVIKYSIQKRIGKIVYGNAPILLKPYLSEFNDPLINQNFNFIPYRKFITKLESKCERYGIELLEVDEDFSSILCSKCGYKEAKNRINRGVFHCRKCSYHLHADVNVAINIGKQVSPQFLSELGGSGCMIQPVRVRIDC